MAKHILNKEESLLNKVEKILNKQEKNRRWFELLLIIIVFILTIGGGLIVYYITIDKSPDLTLNSKLFDDGVIQVEVSNDNERNIAENVKILMRDINEENNWFMINQEPIRLKRGFPYVSNITLNYEEIPIDENAFLINRYKKGIYLNPDKVFNELYHTFKINITKDPTSKISILLSNIVVDPKNKENILRNNKLIGNQQYEFKIVCDNCKESRIYRKQYKIELMNTETIKCEKISNENICGHFKRLYLQT